MDSQVRVTETDLTRRGLYVDAPSKGTEESRNGSTSEGTVGINSNIRGGCHRG